MNQDTREEEEISKLENLAWYTLPHGMLRAQGTDRQGLGYEAKEENVREIFTSLLAAKEEAWRKKGYQRAMEDAEEALSKIVFSDALEHIHKAFTLIKEKNI